MNNLLRFLPVFIIYIWVFRFFYLEDGLSLIIHVSLPVVLGIIIASVLNPMLVFIQKKLRVKSRFLAVFITFLTIFAIIAFMVTIIAPSIARSIKQLSVDLPGLLHRADKYISDFGKESPLIKSWMVEATAKLSLLLSSLLNFAIEKVLNTVAALGNLLLAIIISIYVLMDKEKIENWTLGFFCSLLGKKAAHESFKIIHNLYDNVSSYIAGKLMASLITGLLIYLGSKYVIKSPYPAVDGLIIGITNIIPYFGTFIGGVPILLINTLYNQQKGFLMLIYILIVQQVDSLLIDPKILSDKLSIKPIIIIASMIVGGGLFGPVGLFLATPVAALTKTSMDEFIKYRCKENDGKKSAK